MTDLAPRFHNPPCTGATELFFPHTTGRYAAPYSDRAKAICHDCPHRQPCADYATANPDIRGIWGGTTNQERIAIRRGSLTAQARAAIAWLGERQ